MTILTDSFLSTTGSPLIHTFTIIVMKVKINTRNCTTITFPFMMKLFAAGEFFYDDCA
jgi:hypothetical protein